MPDDDSAAGRRFLSLSRLDLETKRACRDRRGRFASCGSGGGGGGGGHAGGGSGGGGGGGGSASPAAPGGDIPAHPTRSQINQAVLAASRARTEHYRAATAELRKPAREMDTERVAALARRADDLTVHLARLRAAAEGRPYSANLVPGSRLNRKPKAGGTKVGTAADVPGRPFLSLGLLGLAAGPGPGFEPGPVAD
jgi:hypothetical protein